MGYACINMRLNDPKNYGLNKKAERVTTNRSMIKRTFKAKGMDYAGSLALQNCRDLLTILKWNKANGFDFFRLSSDLIPWASEYNIEDLPQFNLIEQALFDCGLFVEENGMRITSHPGPFNKLTSPKEHVVVNTIKDLENHGKIFDLLCLQRSPFAKLNIHVGAHYNDRRMALDNFCKNFERLSEGVRSRLTVENDDRASLYSTKELYDEVFSRIGIPIVHDYHHHGFCTGGLSQEEAIKLAASTWGDIVPVVHYSESRRDEKGDDTIKPQAHSDYIYDKIDTYGVKLDVMVEAKMKELTVLRYKELHGEENERKIVA
mgnify:FL=1